MKGSNDGGMRDLEDRRTEGVEADGAVENFRVDDAADAVPLMPAAAISLICSGR